MAPACASLVADPTLDNPNACGAGDGPGGTAHMYREVKRRTGRVNWIDTHRLTADPPARARPTGARPMN